MRRFVLLTLVAASAGLWTAWAGDNVWTSLGPDGGGAWSLVVDPLKPNTVYAVTSAGLFKSTDGGAKWASTSPLPSVSSLVIDPHDSSKVYVAAREAGSGDPRGDGVFKSTDGGASWRALRSGSVAITGPLAIDPEDPRIIYSGGHNDILKSTDGGETWKTSFSGPPGVICCLITRSLVIDAHNPSTVYAVTGGGIFKSTDRGASWSAVYSFSGRGEDPRFATLAIDAKDPSTLYARRYAYGGVYRSTDGGASWSAANSGLPGGDPVNLLNTRALAVHPQRGGTLYLATGDGVFQSTNGAATWTKLDSQPGEGNIQTLAIDALSDGTMYASAYDSTGGRVHKSKDGGASWSAANSGIRALGIGRVAIAPKQPATLYAGATMGILKSTDQGTSWNHISNLALLAIDPQDPATLFGISRGSLEKSTDGGVNWSPAKAGLRGGDCSGVHALTIDPQETRTVYAGLYPCAEGSRDGGVWKSADGGTRWAKLDSQPGGGGVHGLEMDPATNTFYVWNGTGLFRSTDQGASWTNKPGISRISIVTVDPQAPGTLYAVINDNCGNRGCDEKQPGVYKTTDGGESWTTVNSGLPTIYLNSLRVDTVTALVIDPRHTGTLYAGTGANGVYKTTDGGTTWSAVNSGLTTFSIYALAVDPQDSSTVYAGTAGGVFVITFASEQAGGE